MGTLQGDDLFSGFSTPPVRVRTGVRVMRGSSKLLSRMNLTKSPLSLSKKVYVPPSWMLRASQRKLTIKFLLFERTLGIKQLLVEFKILKVAPPTQQNFWIKPILVDDLLTNDVVLSCFIKLIMTEISRVGAELFLDYLNENPSSFLISNPFLSQASPLWIPRQARLSGGDHRSWSRPQRA